MQNAIRLALSIERSTLLDLSRIFTDPAWRKTTAFRCPDPFVRNFWLVEYDELWASKDISPILYKLSGFTSSPELRRLFGQPVPRVSFDEIINTGKIAVVAVPSGVLSQDLARFVSSLVAKQVQLAAHRRVQYEGPRPFIGLWIDEAANYVESGSLLTLVSESRSMRLGTALLTQTTKTFSRELQVSLDVNIATHLTALKIEGQHWLDVKRLHEPEVIRFPHPGPLPPTDRARIEQVRARSRELYGARKPVLLEPVREPEAEALRPAAGAESSRPPRRRRAPLKAIGGRDVEEE